jgi:hypothetical protein
MQPIGQPAQPYAVQPGYSNQSAGFSPGQVSQGNYPQGAPRTSYGAPGGFGGAPGYGNAPGYGGAPSYGNAPNYGGPSGYGARAPNGYQAPYAPQNGGNFPSEAMIPEFGKKLPKVQPSMSSQPVSPTGWATDQRIGPPMTPDEVQVTKFEQAAFGSTYPEHEVEDRVDHLEKEIFGSKSDAPLPERLSKIEAKLAGSGTFSQTSAH